ncbi:MAG: exodeoxyribonuclease VII large subunit [Clostridiales bacterium]|nr:exodeoxyribonuclease VII large subunit [Clostridiales bacterium]MDY4622013.1 exodeoxyribonuclease VII large subunit [Eubacteriales bacterium]
MPGIDLTLSVSKLNEYVNSLLSNDLRLRSVKVKGEISALRLQQGSGHLYFTLKDETAVIRCIMFASKVASLRFEPADGMKVIVSGKVEIYSPSGQYSFNVTGMQQAGEGELYRQFVETSNRLRALGLFDRKRPIPSLPKCVGVVTSDTGAALHDITSVIRRRFPCMDIVVAPAAVQGKNAPSELIRALEAVNNDARADVIIIGRGGGSYEELSCFNDEQLAYAVFNSRIPVISAVGHEVDFTIVDFVSDLRAPTPSAAAEICVPVYSELTEAMNTVRSTLNGAAMQRIDMLKLNLMLTSETSALSDPSSIFTDRIRRINDMAVNMKHALERHFGELCSKHETRTEKLMALNPNAVLSRGYAIVKSENGQFLRSISDAEVNDRVEIILSDGKLNARICE